MRLSDILGSEVFDVEGHRIAVFRTRAGTVRAVANRCPHKNGPLADGMLAGDAVVCPQVVGVAWRQPLVHALLHLLGYEHGAEMEARESELAR